MTMFAFVGCSSVEPLDGVKRQPKDSVEVYFEGNVPTRPYKVIGTFSERSNPGQEEQAHRNFVNKAKKLGADAVIIGATKAGGMEVGPLGASTKEVYTDTAIVWE